MSRRRMCLECTVLLSLLILVIIIAVVVPDHYTHVGAGILAATICIRALVWLSRIPPDRATRPVKLLQRLRQYLADDEPHAQ